MSSFDLRTVLGFQEGCVLRANGASPPPAATLGLIRVRVMITIGGERAYAGSSHRYEVAHSADGSDE